MGASKQLPTFWIEKERGVFDLGLSLEQGRRMVRP